MIAPRHIRDIELCERELDSALTQLRQVQNTQAGNLLAQASIEYRIGALRRRREELR